MNIRHSLLALSALTLPAAAFAQCWRARARRRCLRHRPQQLPRAPGRGAVDGAAAAPPGQPWQSPIAEANKAPALEPIDLPPAIEQGVDMIYIDEELVPRAVHDNGPMGDMTFAAWSGAPVDLFTSVNPIYTDLRRGLVKYQQRWGDLPQLPIPAGPTLKPGSTGDRVALLRTRLGLAAGNKFDAALAAR